MLLSVISLVGYPAKQAFMIYKVPILCCCTLRYFGSLSIYLTALRRKVSGCIYVTLYIMETFKVRGSTNVTNSANSVQTTLWEA